MALEFSLPRFYPILDTAALAAQACPVLNAARTLLEAGVKILQYRHKENWTPTEYDEAAQLKVLCDQAGALFVLNDRADYSHLLDAALHLGQNDLPPVAARKVVRQSVIGFSTHNRRQLIRANDEPVEYLSLGPIFVTASKLKPDPVLGVDGLRALRPLSKKPVVAIGGIKLENAPEVLAAGADSVAVITAILPGICDRSSIKQRASEWLKATA